MTPSRDGLLARRIRDLRDEDGWLWIHVWCACWTDRPKSKLPCRYLTEHRKGDVVLADFVRHLRCSQCGAAPVRVAVTNDATFGATGKPTAEWAWRIDVGP